MTTLHTKTLRTDDRVMFSRLELADIRLRVEPTVSVSCPVKVEERCPDELARVCRRLTDRRVDAFLCKEFESESL